MLKKTYAICVLISIYYNSVLCDEITDRITGQGYRGEAHFVHTDDGYILCMHRLYSVNTHSVSRPALFLMHGMFSSSGSFLLYPNFSAAYYFGNLGYDVWIGNGRGNKFSRNHTSLSPDDNEFWKFSWHEIGFYDLPAMIDYALSMSQQSKLMYIGHSLGVTTVMVMLSMKPEYNDKISILHALTTPIIIKHNPESYFERLLEVTFRNYARELFTDGMTNILKGLIILCDKPITRAIFKFVHFSIFGETPHYYDSLYMDGRDCFPTGGSTKQVVHYFQIGLTGKFQQFYYGRSENIRIYGLEMPPVYNLTNIRTKLHILYGRNDILTSPGEINRNLLKVKKNVIAITKFSNFNHADFTIGKQVNIVQQKILEITRRFE